MIVIGWPACLVIGADPQDTTAEYNECAAHSTPLGIV
jgi:hypothetical protein